jgi:HlyD family secretion protein
MEPDMTDFEADLHDTENSMRSLMLFFAGTMLVLVLGVGGWAVLSHVESAVVANGNFIVRSNGQAVQHLQGGVVGKILVDEGDRVRKGQVVVKLDSEQVDAQLSILKKRLIELTAERARLLAERDDRDRIPMPKRQDGGGETDMALRAALELQQTLLDARRTAHKSKLQQLTEQRAQVESHIAGLRQIQVARREELVQVGDDLKVHERLDQQRLIRRSVLRQIRRQFSRLRGDIWDITSKIAGQSSKLTEIKFRISEVSRKAQSDVLDRLQEVKAQLGETFEKHRAAVDRMTRLDIRAPSDGIVHELKIHTVGGVIPPGQTIMTIVPDDEPLLLLARIKPSEVDQVKIGQKATARISAFDNQAAPELDGTVLNVSADRSQDQRTGVSFFTLKIEIAKGQEAKLIGKRLTAGLPADVFIRGEARRVITYLTKPLLDQMAFTFKEE